MTLPQNVADAVTRLDMACVDGRVMPSDDAWQTIRAHLMIQEAEIADLISKRDFLLRHYNDAESRVAAANALLSKDAEYPECSGDPTSCPENEGYGCCKNPTKDAS